MITHENAYKIGFYDAYFMGAQDTATDYWPDDVAEKYQAGHQAGENEYFKNE